MKVKKTGAMFAKALLLTSSLFVVNNMWAMGEATTRNLEWVQKIFIGSVNYNFVWRSLRNKSNNSVEITLSIPSEKDTRTFTLAPKEEIWIPSRYINKDDTRNGMYISVNAGGKSYSMTDSFYYTYVVSATGTITPVLNPRRNTHSQRGRRKVLDAREIEHGLE